MNLSFLNLPPLQELPWKERDQWSLSDVAIQLQRSDFGVEPLSLADCLRGTQIFGSPGSGKTSGACKFFARSYLKYGFGGLVLTVKNDEAESWIKHCKFSGRENDLIVISEDNPLSFNFLESAGKISSTSFSSLNVAQILIDIQKLLIRSDSSQKQDPFWTDQLRSCLVNTINIVRKHHGVINVASLTEAFSCAEDHANTVELCILRGQKTKFELIYGQEPTSQSHQFFLEKFASLPEKTRSIIVSMFNSVFEPLGEFPLKNIFGTLNEVNPMETFSGKIIVVNIPVHRYRNAGLLCQLIWKISFMNAVTDRTKCERPVFLWADESQFFVEERDIDFMTTIRSQRCAVVYSTQNIQNYESVLGTQAKVAAVLAAMNNRIYHQNNDPGTNELAARSIGKVLKKRISTSKSSNSKNGSTKSVSYSKENEIDERAFMKLKSGGFENHLEVEAICHISGKVFSKGKSHFTAKFKQGN